MVNVNAFVTLLTSDSYIQGVVALAHSLHLTHTHNELVCMVTEGVSQDIIERLEKPGDLYDKVIRVNEFDSKDQKNLELLGRPELGVTFTKLNVWKLCQYDFVAFLDADTIVLKNIDSLFDQIKEVYNHGDVAFLAAPDVGWPDNFNSGVFVCKPDLQTYSDLVNYSRTTGSYDGGDQGLLNRFFNKWNSTPNARLSFNYNVTPSAYYTYAPAFKEHQDDISVVHFIGNNKPWKSGRGNEMKKGKESNSSSSIIKSSSPFDHLVSLWWNVYDNYSVSNPKGQGEFLKSYDQSVSHSNASFNHPYDNAWYTKIIQEPNNLPEKELEIIESKEELEIVESKEEQEIQNKDSNENKYNNDDENEYKNDDKTENEEWQNTLPYKISSYHPTDYAYITKVIKVNTYENENEKENEKENDNTMETQPRDLNIPENNISIPNQSEQKNIKEVVLDDTSINSSIKNITSVQQIEERIEEKINASPNTTSNYSTPIKTYNDDDDFANYHISWNFNELRGFRKQYRKYIKETEKPYISMNWDNKNENIEADPRDASILASEPESEINEEKDDIMNISNLPGIHVSEFEDEIEEDEDLHEQSFNKSMTKNEDINIEDFDVYGFNYEDDIKRKSFTSDSNDYDISKNGGRRRRKSIIEVINGLDGLAMPKMSGLNGEEDNAFVDKSLSIEEPLEVTGIIEDNFENDLFINEDEIENLSFIKNHNQHVNQEYDNANRSFVSMNQKEIEKDNIIVEPIPSNEITEVIANGNDTILPNDINIEEVVFVNDSIIPNDIIADNREVTVNDSMIPSEILKPKVEKYEETETEITEVPKYNDMFIQVNNIEVQPQQFISELSSCSNKELLLSKTGKMFDKSISEENTLALDDPTIINNTFEKRIQTFLGDIPEKIEEVEDDEEKKEKKEKEKEEEKDQTILDSIIEDFTTEIISEESVNEDIATNDENIETEPKSLSFNEVPEVIPVNASSENVRYSFITEPKSAIFTEVVQPIEKVHVDDEISEIEENVIEGESKEVTFKEPTEEVYEIYIEDVTQYDNDSIDESDTNVKHIWDEKYEIVIEDVIQESGDNIDVNNKNTGLEDPKNEIYEEIVQQDDDKNKNIEVVNKDIDIVNPNQEEYVYEIEDSYYDDNKEATIPINNSYEIVIEDVIEDEPSKENVEANDRDASLEDPNQGISECIVEEKPQSESDVEATAHITEDITEDDKGKSINETTQVNSIEDNSLEDDSIIQEESNEIEDEEIISKPQNENNPDEPLRKKIIVKKYIKRRILKPREEKIDIEGEETEQSIPIVEHEQKTERGYEQPISIIGQEQEFKPESEQESEQESVEEDYTISRIEIHELIAEVESSSSEEDYDSEVNDILPQENEPTEVREVEVSGESKPEQKIDRRRIIKRIIRRNGQTYVTETEEPIDDDEVEVSEESGSEQETRHRRIIKRIIRRNGQTYVTETEEPIEDDEEVEVSSKSVSSSHEKVVIEQNIPQEVEIVEKDDSGNDKVVRKRIIKRIIRRNGQTYVTETEEPIENGEEVEVLSKTITTPQEEEVIEQIIPQEVEIVEKDDSGNDKIVRKRIIKKIIRRNGQTYVTETEEPIENGEEVEVSSKTITTPQEEVIEQIIPQEVEIVEKDDSGNDKIVRKRIIKKIIRRNGQTYVTETEEPIENGEEVEVSSKTITTPQEEVIEQIIPQEVEIVEKDDSGNDKIVRKRIIKKIIRRNGQTYVTETEEKINDNEEAKTLAANEPVMEEVSDEVISSQENKSEQLNTGSKDERFVRRINYKNGYRVIDNIQENSLERNLFTLIPSLNENDEVLLYTIIIFGKDQNELLKQFETATNDYNFDKISAEKYYSIYITILKELCKVKGGNDDRYQSLDTPFMKEYSEKLWCSIANNIVKEESVNKSVPEVKDDKDDDAIKKKRRSCLPFFRKRSKKRHSILSKHKKSKSVDANAKFIKINDKKQEMLEAKEKYIENEKNKIKQLNTDETINEENSEEVRTTDIKQTESPKEKEVDISEAPVIKQEEKNEIPEIESKTQITITGKTKKDNKKKEKKRWWKRIIGKKNDKKKDKKN